MTLIIIINRTYEILKIVLFKEWTGINIRKNSNMAYKISAVTTYNNWSLQVIIGIPKIRFFCLCFIDIL